MPLNYFRVKENGEETRVGRAKKGGGG